MILHLLHSSKKFTIILASIGISALRSLETDSRPSCLLPFKCSLSSPAPSPLRQDDFVIAATVIFLKNHLFFNLRRQPRLTELS